MTDWMSVAARSPIPHGGGALAILIASWWPASSRQSSRLQPVYYSLIQLGDPLIGLESLYGYLRKFHALGRRRYVLVPALHLFAALVVLLSLEFLPHRSQGR